MPLHLETGLEGALMIIRNVTRICWIAAAVLVIVGGAVRLIPTAYPPLPHLASAGEWITTADGRRVCQLTADLTWGTIMSPSDCTDFQPGFRKWTYGMAIDGTEGWARTTGGRTQFHVEQRWIP